MSDKKLIDQDCECGGTGIVRMGVAKGTIYCGCDAGDMSRDYDAGNGLDVQIIEENENK